MAITLVSGQSAGTESTSTGNLTVTFPGSTTAGNLVVVWIASNSAATTTYTVTDNKANAWSQGELAAWDTGWGVRIGIFYCLLASGKAGASHSVTVAGSSTNQISAVVGEFAGVNATPFVSTEHNTAPGTGTAPSSGNVPIGAAGELLAGCVTDTNGSGTNTITQGTGFTKLFEAHSSLGQSILAEYQVLSSAVATPATATLTSSDDWWAAGAAFVAAAGGGPAFVAPRPYVPRQAVKRASYY